jgi:LPXTG-motif cell wall-anchored protein
VLSTQTEDWNTTATAPEVADKDGFTFNGWDTDFSAIIKDLAIIALYEEAVVNDTEEIPTMIVQDDDDSAVIEQEETPQAKSVTIFPWWWILIGVGGAGLLLILWLFFKRRKKDELILRENMAI